MSKDKRYNAKIIKLDENSNKNFKPNAWWDTAKCWIGDRFFTITAMVKQATGDPSSFGEPVIDICLNFNGKKLHLTFDEPRATEVADALEVASQKIRKNSQTINKTYQQQMRARAEHLRKTADELDKREQYYNTDEKDSG